nr:leucine-rich repeat and immunoglobulin-like domain-containing nogo receptor-interacting protein 3 [Ciona intestinalis]|eukprot:XP_002131523.1 leucine-rich repeat and immunoglobulin-like domain-containing nogo receptor-interacting protein 3 [Ciona intestinalis]
MWLWLSITTIVCVVVNVKGCLELCQCNKQGNVSSVICNGWITQHNLSSGSQCSTELVLNSAEMAIYSNIEIRCYNVSFQLAPQAMFHKVKAISIHESHFEELPFQFLASLTALNRLNFSENRISDLVIPKRNNSYHMNHLDLVDLSKNEISEVKLYHNNLFSNVKALFLQQNRIGAIENIQRLPQLEILAVSDNPINLMDSDFSLSSTIQQMHLRNVSSVNALESCKTCCFLNECAFLPPNLILLDLSNNHLMSIPTRHGLLAGLLHLQVLLLQNNNISIIRHDSFVDRCYFKLREINLSNNRLIKLDGNAFAHLWQLNNLNLASNFLQHLPIKVAQSFLSLQGQKKQGNLSLNGNPWSCDCLQHKLAKILTPNTTLSIICKIPQSLQGSELQNISLENLQCHNTSFAQKENVTAYEYKDVNLICTTLGAPRSEVKWFTPKHELISLETIAFNKEQQKSYSLSEFGDILTVKSVRLSKTGIFKCFANNAVSSANQTIALAVILSPTSTIVYIVVACVAFMVAIVLNSVNMCMYICEHMEIKRQYRKMLQAQEEEEKQNPPIRSRSKNLDESLASLNANKHYGRYDFTCQQMFLDTVVKGAHSVKKTLYDARHSEFSVNMWEYAANLRERLHIEMPSSVQLPSISMPTISMPTISMPSIPTMQDININIEKLSSSMVQRSHTLASSVGSVFTLKRWMQQQNSSDTESRESDDNLDDGPSITQVTVHVHTPNEEPSIPTPLQLNEEPCAHNTGDSATKLKKKTLKECYTEKAVTFYPQESEHFLEPQTSEVRNVVTPLLATISGGVDNQWSYETSV